MRFPLSMTAGMAGYIFKNKMRPKPEWQKSVAATAPNPSFGAVKRNMHRPRSVLLKARVGTFERLVRPP